MVSRERKTALRLQMINYLEAALACADESGDRAIGDSIERAIGDAAQAQWPALEAATTIRMKSLAGMTDPCTHETSAWCRRVASTRPICRTRFSRSTVRKAGSYELARVRGGTAVDHGDLTIFAA